VVAIKVAASAIAINAPMMKRQSAKIFMRARHYGWYPHFERHQPFGVK